MNKNFLLQLIRDKNRLYGVYMFSPQEIENLALAVEHELVIENQQGKEAVLRDISILTPPPIFMTEEVFVEGYKKRIAALEDEVASLQTHIDKNLLPCIAVVEEKVKIEQDRGTARQRERDLAWRTNETWAKQSSLKDGRIAELEYSLKGIKEEARSVLDGTDC